MASCPASTAENGCLSEVNEKAFKKKKVWFGSLGQEDFLAEQLTFEVHFPNGWQSR